MANKTYSQYKEQALKDKKLAKAYAELGPQYEVIKELISHRIEQGITQEELARRTGIKKSNLSRFENGKHSPTLSMVYRIAGGLGKRVQFSLED